MLTGWTCGIKRKMLIWATGKATKQQCALRGYLSRLLDACRRKGRSAGSSRGDGKRYTMFLRSAEQWRFFSSLSIWLWVLFVWEALNNEFLMRARLWTFCNATLVPRGRRRLVFSAWLLYSTYSRINNIWTTGAIIYNECPLQRKRNVIYRVHLYNQHTFTRLIWWREKVVYLHFLLCRLGCSDRARVHGFMLHNI